jgi:predicted membrane-bound spermidine synthase
MVKLEKILEKMPKDSVCIIKSRDNLICIDIAVEKKENKQTWLVHKDVSDFEEWGYLLIALRKIDFKKVYNELEKEKKEG